MDVNLPGVDALWLCDISEPRTNDLRVVVLEIKSASEQVMTPVGMAIPVRPDTTSRAFELIWSHYVAYSMRNESYFAKEDGEVLGPEALVTRTSSAYLTYVAATTFASDDYPGLLTHWRLYTQWHCLDVVSSNPPDIREMTPKETAAELARFTNA